MRQVACTLLHSVHAWVPMPKCTCTGVHAFPKTLIINLLDQYQHMLKVSWRFNYIWLRYIQFLLTPFIFLVSMCMCMPAEVQKFIGASWQTLVFFITTKFCTLWKLLCNILLIHAGLYTFCAHKNAMNVCMQCMCVWTFFWCIIKTPLSILPISTKYIIYLRHDGVL